VGAPSATASIAPTRSDRPAESTAFNNNAGAIIGGVIAAVVFLVIVAAAALHWQRKKRLLERPTLPYIPPMSSNGNILPTTNLSAGSGLQGSHPKFGAPVRSERVPITDNPFSSSNLGASTASGSGSQLSASTIVSSSNLIYSYSPDSRAVYQPREPSAQPPSHFPATSEPQTQPLLSAQSTPPTKPRQSLPPHIQTLTTVQPHSTDGFTATLAQTSFSGGSAGMQPSYAYQPHPQSIFGDLDNTPDRPRYQSRIMSPPPDYWSSARQDAG